MKWIHLPIVLLAFAALGCGNANDELPAASTEVVEEPYTQPMTQEGVVDAVTSIYNRYFESGVFNEYDMQKFFAPDFNEAYNRCIAIQDSTGYLIIDYDVWLNAQDFNGLALSNVSVSSFQGNSAVVKVEFRNLGSDGVTILSLKYDEGREAWFVDDFISPNNNESYKAYLLKSIATPMEV